MADRVREKIWTFMDEWGLLSGVDRLPGESLLNFRGRVIGHEKYDSSEQGLVHYISDSLLTTGYNVVEKKQFFSTYVPLSLSAYQAIPNPGDEYYNPRIIVGSTTWVILPTSDMEKDTIVGQDITWTLWKQPDGKYDRVWTTDTVPTGDVELRYQWQDEGGILHVVKESSKILTWEDGEIVEDYPPEVL